MQHHEKWWRCSEDGVLQTNGLFFPSILLFKENKIMAFITLWTYMEIGTEHFFQLLLDLFVVGVFFSTQ